jgi:asparagine synthase (glutamine-hydrolysing)
MSEIIPSSITEGTKKGFSSPDASWFKGESTEFVKLKLLDPKARMYDFLRFDIAEDLLNEHSSGKKNRRLLIWSLLSLGSVLSWEWSAN